MLQKSSGVIMALAAAAAIAQEVGWSLRCAQRVSSRGRTVDD